MIGHLARAAVARRQHPVRVNHRAAAEVCRAQTPGQRSCSYSTGLSKLSKYLHSHVCKIDCLKYFSPDTSEGHLPGELSIGRLLAAHDPANTDLVIIIIIIMIIIISMGWVGGVGPPIIMTTVRWGGFGPPTGLQA